MRIEPHEHRQAALVLTDVGAGFAALGGLRRHDLAMSEAA
jgi:hypothetical protein